ncbi:nuclear transport factor 2 family protein [Sphaerimonospora sp. CA-214678]|uniref:nuclear transport factor 2 family protein n=1 Tax=Sphaerimonospora sp. CA-214678 TaxID=3240029 RepID=UPI003D8CA1F6
MNVLEAALSWTNAWTVGWARQDVELIVERQAEDGVHWSQPFRPPHRGRPGLREYLEDVFASEVEPTRARFAPPLVNGDQAAAEYWALCHYEDGPLIISGCTLLRFDEEGLVAESRDYSFVVPGEHPFPFDW